MSKVEERPFIPFARADIGDDEINEVVAALRSGWLTMGPRTKQFEEDFSKYTGAGHSIAVNSATSGLFLLAHALGWGPGDEIITTPLTFAASANILVHTGARPVFADVARDGWSLDPEQVAAKKTAKTRGAVVVHYAGAAADVAGIERALGAGKTIVEDCAHAVGTRYPDGTHVGTKHPAAFSFYATKNVTTGEGGMMTVADEAFADRLRSLRLHGISRDAWKRYSKEGTWYYEVLEHGYKMNMTDVNAAMGLHQLRKAEAFNRRRREICTRYDEAFADLPLERPTWVSTPNAAAHLYPILVDDPKRRDGLIEGLLARNIGTSVHFIPLHLQPAFQKNFGYKRGDFPNAEHFYDRTVSLPLYPIMTDEDIGRVIDGVRELLA